jgi:tRNA-specific 2-thiouridylase
MNVKSKPKVFVAVSGGVDSACSTALLLKAGYDCSAMFMITHDHAQSAQADAQKVADHLGIKLHILDFRENFSAVLDYFCDEYKKGRTPNPCVFCNRTIKFGKLWQFAQVNGADYIATGHYIQAIKTETSIGLYTAKYLQKDQSYALAMIDRSVLDHLLLPLGGYQKPDVRKLAADLGLHVEQKADSQEICFIPDQNYIGLLELRCPQLARPGSVIDSSGAVIGAHNGVHRFTIGQRRGLGIAKGSPVYVTAINAETNTVTLGPKSELMHNGLVATRVNWLIDAPIEPFKAKIKIRYNHAGQSGTVIPQGNTVTVQFDEPIAAITPGQAAVFYIQQNELCRLVGGAWIEKVTD